MGLIPARAGSTVTATCIFGRVRAHPRPCGEHMGRKAIGPANQGSSPPVRGARTVGDSAGVQPGLIPARAGSTSFSGAHRHPGRAHPRPCGEHGRGSGDPCTGRGSSPPVRGARNSRNVLGAALGLIPARAGSTPPCTQAKIQTRAHPRPCGEH